MNTVLLVISISVTTVLLNQLVSFIVRRIQEKLAVRAIEKILAQPAYSKKSRDINIVNFSSGDTLN